MTAWTAEERLAATAPWSEDERRAWEAPDIPTVSEWADRHRVIPKGDHAIEPGRWRTARAPYLREVMDALSIQSPYTEVTFMASARVGKTEVGNNAVSYWADVDPDPICYLWPDKEKATEDVHDRIEPMLRASPRTARLFSDRAWDVKKRRIKLTTCSIRVAWSRSATTLAGFQARYRVADEVDKFGQPRGEASACKLLDARGMQYGPRGKSYKVSTPTTPHGEINQSWLSCRDRRRFHVPCPHCDLFQVLRPDQLRWDGPAGWEDWLDATRAEKLLAADEVKMGLRQAWFECDGCHEKILDHHKPAMLARGEWRSEGYAPGEHPVSDRVGFHIWVAYSPWVRFCEIVAERLTTHAQGPREHQNYVNSWEGRPFEEERAALSPAIIMARVEPFPRFLAPAWTRAIIAGADVQQSSAWWVVRAFGSGGLSRLLDFGQADDWEQLRLATIARTWEVEKVPGLELRTRLLCVDVGGGGKALVGTRTDETYRFVAAHPALVWAVRGKGGEFNPENVEPFSQAKSGKGKLHGVGTRMLNTQHYKSHVAGLIRSPDGLWQEASHVDDEGATSYARQLSAEKQVWRHAANGTAYLWWEKARPQNHLLDATVYAVAGADMLGVENMPTAQQVWNRESQRRRHAAAQSEGTPWVEASGWHSGGGGW